jgi:hypothetical protein
MNACTYWGFGQKTPRICVSIFKGTVSHTNLACQLYTTLHDNARFSYTKTGIKTQHVTKPTYLLFPRPIGPSVIVVRCTRLFAVSRDQPLCCNPWPCPTHALRITGCTDICWCLPSATGNNPVHARRHNWTKKNLPVRRSFPGLSEVM